MKLNKQFFELIKVSLGVLDSNSAQYSERRWQALYDIAQQQALTGICFAGVRRLMEQGINIPQQLYYEWLAQVGFIHQQNERLNHESAELCHMISQRGYSCCILKGQAVANLYDGELKTLRQPGDIDAWVIAQPKDVIKMGNSFGRIYYYDYHHADLELFPETEIELHYRPTLSRNLWRNARLQKWIKRERERLIIQSKELGFGVPCADFSLILTLNHNLWHLLYEGVGMRQMMDLYFVLRSHTDGTEKKKLLKHFSLMHFAAASMWVMQEAFGLESKYFVCEPDEERGRFLLNEIMLAGNFGHHDSRLKRDGSKNRVILMGRWIKHSMRLFRYYTVDVLWTPIGILYISLWRRWNYMIDKQIKHNER